MQDRERKLDVKLRNANPVTLNTVSAASSAEGDSSRSRLNWPCCGNEL